MIIDAVAPAATKDIGEIILDTELPYSEVDGKLYVVLHVGLYRYLCLILH